MINFKNILEATSGTGETALIAGPCSAESEQQLIQTAMELNSYGVKALRAGLWKPRTRPGNFEGVGEEGLEWMCRAREVTGMSLATEVATPSHIEACLEAGIEILWIGTRTSGNPFAMAELANALKGAPEDLIVLVKNPLCPGIDTWIGAVERIICSGLKNIGVIHRGFADFSDSVYRNPPHWEVARKLRSELPGVPMIIDPSHIAGRRELIPGLMRQAIDLGFNAFMIESHINPAMALTDAKQQLTPAALSTLVNNLTVNSQRPRYQRIK
ncbi:MAG: 3-deoxy-7-phosphoheptulonate synthase [Prevotella sp.]|nr:3-deoxy-7-phosphoheptulonate synthase [Bacteroides sp.]MCM1367125.1 3-deoxy-7-phosphoheptulonate synthase [Prevotella sp.]MCM1437441.1 3-deoxy-7-phosphoheptulonate synthase [Prevotella sp.]